MRTHAWIVVAALLLPLEAAAEPEMSPSEIIDIAESGVGSPYVWGGGCWDPANRSRLGADCSGYVAKCWQVPEASAVTTCSHPYSTYNFYNENTHWDDVDRSDARHVDAFVYRSGDSGHIVLFNSGDPWGNCDVYEARGTAYGIVHRTRTFDSSYRVRRRHSLVPDGPPPHPALTLSSAIDTIGGQERDLCTAGGSAGLFDVYVGQSFVERFYVANDGDAGASGVVVGLEIGPPYLQADDYEIYDNYAGHDCGAEWCLNDSNAFAANPPHDTPATSLVLQLGGLSPGETKMIVLQVTALAPSFGAGAIPEVRLWVMAIADYYAKDAYDSGFDNVSGYQTFNGGDLRVATRQSVLGDELCNNTDDDCDGAADEGFEVGSACQVGVGACAVDGMVVCRPDGTAACDGTPAGATDEVCDNGVDEDCDGTADDGCGGTAPVDPDDAGPTDPDDGGPADPPGGGSYGTNPVEHLGMIGDCGCRAAGAGDRPDDAPLACAAVLLLAALLLARLSRARPR